MVLYIMKGGDDMDDHRILELLWTRAEQAIEELARRFGSRLHSTAVNLLGSPQDAEEVVSDTYIALWNAIPPKQPEPLAPYVYRTGRNIALNRLRANTARKRSAYEVSLDELSNYIPARPDSGRELGRAMDAFLDTVSKESRAIFLRRYWFGDSVKDIARAFHMTENAVSVRLHRTRNELKDYLIKEGYYE